MRGNLCRSKLIKIYFCVDLNWLRYILVYQGRILTIDETIIVEKYTVKEELQFLQKKFNFTNEITLEKILLFLPSIQLF